MYKRILAVIVVSVFMLALLACGKDKSAPTEPAQPAQPALAGVWSCEIDLTEEIDDFLYAQLNANHICTQFSLTLHLTIDEAGTYALGYDRELLDEELEKLGQTLWQMVVDEAAANNGVSEEAASGILREQGKNRETLIQELNFGSIFDNNYSKKGLWKQENDMLYFAEDQEGLLIAEGFSFELGEDQLAILYPGGIDASNEPVTKKVIWNKINA